MLGFFAPWALAGLLLLAVPVTVHIFKPRKTRHTVFTNLRWLKESRQKLSRRIQWHQLLLFLLRAAIILLLVLALARPLLSPKGAALNTERFIVLDRSRTMNYAEEGKETPFLRGRALAENLLSSAGPGDRSTVILASRTLERLGPLAADPRAYSAALQAALPSAEDGDLSSSLATIRAMVSDRRKDAVVEVVFITNNLQRNWSQSAISDFLAEVGGNVKITLVDVSPTGMRNAWIASASLMEGDAHKPPAIHAQVGWTGDAEIAIPLHVKDLPGLAELSTTVELKPGQLSEAVIELPAGYTANGNVARLELRSTDGLPDDDVYLLDLDVRGLTKVLVIEPHVTQVTALQPGLHLRTALQALAAEQKNSLEIQSVTPDEVTPALISEAHLVILVEPRALSQLNAITLRNRVRAGAGLAIFLGPAVDVSFFNDTFHNMAEPAASISPVQLKSIIRPSAHSSNIALTQIDWRHPILSNLFDPTYGDLPQTRFQSYFQTSELPPDSPVRVLARIGDSTPAILESSFGAGHVVIFNTTANDAWSDLPRRPGFVPLLDQLVTFLTGGFGRGEVLIGESVSLPLGAFNELPEVSVTAPSGEVLRPSLQRISGQVVMRIERVREAGIHTIEIAGKPGKRTFTVQAGRADSPLARMDMELLRQWWAPTEVSVVRTDDAPGKAAVKSDRILLWPWLIGLGCLMMIGEMFMVHWVCPALNPALTQAGAANRQRSKERA